MVIDRSALICILKKEPECKQFMELIVDAERAAVSAPTMLEIATALRRFDPAFRETLRQILSDARIAIIPFGPEHLPVAEEAHRRYGRGSGHPAKLNFGDCISYATAMVANEPLLFKGDAFSQTDVPTPHSARRRPVPIE